MSQLIHYALYLLYPFYDPVVRNSQNYFLTYFTAGLTALLITLVIKRRFSLPFRAIRRLLLPNKLWQHPSNWLDVKLYFVSLYYLVFQVLLVGGSTLLSVAAVVNFLTHAFGPAHIASGPSWLVTSASMLLVFLAVEFGYWLSHFMLHKLPFLWEFHKVHHSAEVLTPLTEFRQHPLELVLHPMLMTGAASIVQGPMVWIFGAGAMVIDPVEANIISMFFWFTIQHLRHTHIPIYATGLLGKIIQAPAHHQVHHSTNPAHYDTNLGYCLSIFDWMFGTLYVPKKGEKFEYGLGHEDHALETVTGSLFAPIGRVFMMAMRALRGRFLVAPLRKRDLQSK